MDMDELVQRAMALPKPLMIIPAWWAYRRSAMYYLRVWCDRCLFDPHGCFNGTRDTIWGSYETYSDAVDAGDILINEFSIEPWKYEVVDEHGDVIK